MSHSPTRRSLGRRTAALAVCVSAVASLLYGATQPASAQEKPAAITLTVKESKLGPIIVDGKGMSLYMFVPDARNVSVCEGQCLVAWPPVMLAEKQTLADVKLEGNLRRSLLGVAMRFDGSRQVTYNGWPLYYWFRDKAAGDVLGQWVGSVWFVFDEFGDPINRRA